MTVQASVQHGDIRTGSSGMGVGNRTRRHMILTCDTSDCEVAAWPI